MALSVVKNKWNAIIRQYREIKLLKNSSGAGSGSKIFPDDVLEEFIESHPDADASLNNFEELDSILSERIATGKNAITVQTLIDSVASESSNNINNSSKLKKSSMSPFEDQIIKMVGNLGSKPQSFLTESLLILENIGLDDNDYFDAVDVLSKDNNAMAFYSLPESRRKAFILKKLNKF